ncbi:YfiR family protein [Phenylobacterium sp.]|uniref:YfiR family protein n=1 Tax=Phenylobacterium sp. TaxID=1871053 RepID=UPI00273398E9|nr:YfiR family protein [Phenylobacterium sp.]MDP3853061.1 YfiR family protein [Phenylobacterium sp.]
MLALIGAIASGTPGRTQTNATEAAVKATYLYKFAPFVRWPASAFPSPSSPFYLCVLGNDPFGAVLNQAVSGQQLDGRPMAVRRLRGGEGGGGCHILYLGDAGGRSTAEALRNAKGAPVLTVADQNQAVPGAVIQFMVRNGRVRFDIDPAAAAANGVTISSKLLSLAVSARPGG